jgi:hypothetical protein
MAQGTVAAAAAFAVRGSSSSGRPRAIRQPFERFHPLCVLLALFPAPPPPRTGDHPHYPASWATSLASIPAAINHRVAADSKTIETTTTTMTAMIPPFLIGALCGRCGGRASRRPTTAMTRSVRRNRRHAAAGLAPRLPSVARGADDTETSVKTDALLVVRYRFIINSFRAATSTAAAVEAPSCGNRPRFDEEQFISSKLSATKNRWPMK